MYEKNKKFLACYLRLSDEDWDRKAFHESNSISNQREIIFSYIKNQKEFNAYSIKEYCDDGYSGINFQRPGWKRLMEAVERDEIYGIVVKDFSRLGRNYIETGDYLERILPFFRVRFISVSDDYDSFQDSGNTKYLEMELKTLMHDWYSRDLSRKIKSVKKMYQQKGYYNGGVIPYGYQRPANQTRKVIYQPHPRASAVVREIFALAAEGNSTGEIARYLNRKRDEKQEQNNRCRAVSNESYERGKKYLWSADQVRSVVKNKIYKGLTIYSKYDERLAVLKNMDTDGESLVFVGIYEALVTEELFNMANKTIAGRRKIKNKQQQIIPYLLRRKVKCGHCGYSMNRCLSVKKPYFICRMGKSCTGEKKHINEKKLENVVLCCVDLLLFLTGWEENTNNGEDSLKKKSIERKKKRLEVRKILLYCDWKDGKKTTGDYQREIKELELKYKNNLQKATEVYRKKEQEEVNTKRWTYQNRERLRQEALITMMVDKIKVYDEENIELYWRGRDIL